MNLDRKMMKGFMGEVCRRKDRVGDGVVDAMEYLNIIKVVCMENYVNKNRSYF